MTNQAEQPLQHTDDDSQEFIARMRQLYSGQEVAVDRLRELYEGDDSQAFQEFLDDITYAALEENTEFLENARKARSTHSTEEQQSIRSQQRKIFDEAKQFVLMEAGLPTEASLDEIDTTRKKIAEILRAKLDLTSEHEINDVLTALGIVTTDEEGNERFTYPNDLFPDSVNKKWEAYNQSVLEYFRIERAVEAGTRGREDLQVIDGSRRIAHNAVAHGVDEILGLSELPEAVWDFEKSRKLITKMRDMKYPTVETAERASTNNAVGAGLMGLHSLRALNIKVANLKK